MATLSCVPVRQLAPGELKSYAIRLTIAKGGPRTRNDALAEAGKSVVHAVPGFVISANMSSAKLFVKPPAGARLRRAEPITPFV